MEKAGSAMRGIYLLLIALLVSGGCVQTPAKVASGMPAILENVSNDFDNITGPVGSGISNVTGIKSVNVSIVIPGDA